MVRLKEWFTPERVLSKLGALTFRDNIFKTEQLDPHAEMDKALEMFESRPQVNSGIKQYCRFIIGKGLKAVSADKVSQEWLSDWLKKRERIENEVFNHIVSSVVTGNGYFEIGYEKSGMLKIDNIFSLNDSSRVYVNMSQNQDEIKSGENYWIYELPLNIQSYPFQGKMYKPRQWKVTYIRGDAVFKRMVYGIGVDFNKIAMFRTGWSRDGIYGRGFLSSAIDDLEILREILKNMAIISRKRALNVKFVRIGSDEDPATDDDIDELEHKIKERGEDEHIIVNKPIAAEDFDHQGKYDTMEGPIEFLRKDIGSGLVPNFITPWSSDVNRATAAQAKIPFQNELDSFRESYLIYLNKLIVDNLKKSNPRLAEDLYLDFEKVDMDSMEDKMAYGPELYNSNIITKNELRELLGMKKLEDGNKFAKDEQQPMSFSAPKGNFNESNKVYISDKDEAPKGANVQKGKKGGIYYIKGKDSEDDKNSNDISKQGQMLEKKYPKFTNKLKLHILNNDDLGALKDEIDDAELKDLGYDEYEENENERPIKKSDIPPEILKFNQEVLKKKYPNGEVKLLKGINNKDDFDKIKKQGLREGDSLTTDSGVADGFSSTGEEDGYVLEITVPIESILLSYLALPTLQGKGDYPREEEFISDITPPDKISNISKVEKELSKRETFTEARKIHVLDTDKQNVINSLKKHFDRKNIDWDDYKDHLAFVNASYKKVPTIMITGKAIGILRRDIEAGLKSFGLFFVRENISKKESFDLTNDDIDTLEDDDVYFELINLKKRAKKIMSKYKIGAKLSDKWAGKKRKVRSMLVKALEKTLKLERPSVPDLTDELEKKAQKKENGEPVYNINDFRMVARTELNSMRAINALLSFKEAGIEKYRYSAKIDSRTSPICRKLNNKVFTINEGLSDVENKVPSLHPQCRSRVVPAGF